MPVHLEHPPATDPGTVEAVRTPGATTVSSPSPKSRGKRIVLRLLKVVLILLVLAALGRHLWALGKEWSNRDEGLGALTLNGWWLGAAVLFSMFGQVCFGLFWARLLRQAGVISTPYEVLRAYCVGTLGKYIPGKALVVVMRTGLIRRGDIGLVRVGASVFYETTTMMAIAGAAACVCLLVVRPDQWMIWGGAGAVAVGLTGALHPAVFDRLVRLVTLPFKEARADFTSRGWYGTFWRSIALPVGGWLMLGASCWAVAGALGVQCASAGDFALLTGTAALATVAGFLVLFMPAGLGVRELIIIHLLAPRYGASQAVLISLLLRTVWTAVELGLAALLSGLPMAVRRWARPATT